MSRAIPVWVQDQGLVVVLSWLAGGDVGGAGEPNLHLGEGLWSCDDALRWGGKPNPPLPPSCLADHLSHISHDTFIYSRSPEVIASFNQKHRNPKYLTGASSALVFSRGRTRLA